MSNTYTNKVQLADGTTIVDLTGDDVTAADVAQGKIFHLPTGEQATGTASGGGGGTNIQIGQSTPTNILNMFYALEQGTAHHGTFTLATTLPNTNTFLFDMGINDPNGWAVFDTEYYQGVSTTTNYSPWQIWIVSKAFVPYNRMNEYTYASMNANENGGNSSISSWCSGTGIKIDGSAVTNYAYWTLTNGALYAKGQYNKNQQYTPFRANTVYKWVAW